jgi:UTP--glucose-1-phosphate uridylyltransferase
VSKRLRTVVFPVAGFGTRFLPATKTVPKEMLPVVDKPLIHYAVEEARAAGMERFVFVTGRGKGAMESYFDHAFELESVLREGAKDEALRQLEGSLLEPGAAFFTRQQQALGLGHAVACAAPLVDDEPFAVILPDELLSSDPPCLKQMADIYDRHGGNVVAVMDVPPEHTDRYGILDVAGEDGALVQVQGRLCRGECRLCIAARRFARRCGGFLARDAR